MTRRYVREVVPEHVRGSRYANYPPSIGPPSPPPPPSPPRALYREPSRLRQEADHSRGREYKTVVVTPDVFEHKQESDRYKSKYRTRPEDAERHESHGREWFTRKDDARLVMRSQEKQPPRKPFPRFASLPGVDHSRTEARRATKVLDMDQEADWVFGSRSRMIERGSQRRCSAPIDVRFRCTEMSWLRAGSRAGRDRDEGRYDSRRYR